MALINIGFGAASIGSGKNVVHFTHEMSVAQVAKRYAARMTFRFPHRDDDLNAYEDELVEAARKLMPGRIRIIGGAERMTIEQLQSHLDRLIAEGFEPGLIIDDYADLIKPSQRYTDRRFELSANYENLRALSFRYCPIWTASQTTRGALNKEIVTMADLAEDIGKAAICDVLVAMCQTREELESDQCRLFMAKIRDGSKKVPLIQCKFYGASQAIVSTGYVEKHIDEEEVK
jgi:replicative DNA helicase